jgi:hypothetical protein
MRLASGTGTSDEEQEATPQPKAQIGEEQLASTSEGTRFDIANVGIIPWTPNSCESSPKTRRFTNKRGKAAGEFQLHPRHLQEEFPVLSALGHPAFSAHPHNVWY